MKKIRQEIPKEASIRKQILVLLISFLTPLIILLIIYNFYSINILREQTANSNQSVLALYSEALDQQLNTVDVFLVDIIASNSNYNILRNKNQELKIYMATYDLVEQLTQGLNINQKVNMFFLYNEVNQVTREVYKGSSYDYALKVQIRNTIQTLIKKGTDFSTKKWFPVKIDDQYFLLRVLGKNGTFIGALIDVEKLIMPLSKMALQDNYTMLYNTTEGMPLVNQEIVDQYHIELKAGNKAYQLSGTPKRFMVLSEPLSAGGISMTILIPERSIFKGLNSVQVILLVASLMTVLIIPLSIMTIRRLVIKPLDNVVQTINEIKNGNWDSRMDVNAVSQEIRLVNDTFNDMMSEIKTLKIVAYEEKIEKQKAQLQHMQFQIRPHFYLNALTNLYGMAQRQQIHKIQEMILALSNHFRYMFKDNVELVDLKDELTYVKNYMEIQRLCMALPPECRIDVDERLMSLKIPPITLQTFVENAIKHGMFNEVAMKIVISASLLRTEEGEFVDITVTDNGTGFEELLLRSLNFNLDQANDGEHIGVRNVKQRLKLTYGEQAQTVFSNSLHGGAVSEMIIPVSGFVSEIDETSTVDPANVE